jgi:Protein of unknown function (DUF3467)
MSTLLRLVITSRRNFYVQVQQRGVDRVTFFVQLTGLQERNIMDEQRPPQQQGQVQIKADEKELQGQYSNLVMIHHNLEEFTLNFIYIFPNGTQGKLMSSTIVSPGHAKRIWRALGENLARYEAQFGAIKEAPEGGPTPNVGFVQ